MGTPAFFLLFLLCLASSLGARFGLEAWLGAVGSKVEAAMAAPDSVMALPPKPEGLDRTEPEQLGSSSEQGGMGALTPSACEKRYEGDYRDLCYQTAARQTGARDPVGAIEVCKKITKEDLMFECQADVAEASAVVDRSFGEGLCPTIPSVKWRGQCHFGMGLALAEVDSSVALGMCEKAEIFRDFCRHDVVGEVALVDLDAAVAFCSREEGDTLTRKTCWHGIGKYIARRDQDEAAAACDLATASWRGNCYHGLGWGSAERDADAATAGCEKRGIYRDNCRQGVAYQQLRFDPARSVALCETIKDDTIKAKCLGWVRR